MKQGKPKVDIIVCTKNNKKIVGKCLDSVKRQTYKNWKCIVADDGSTDGTIEFLNKNYKWASIMKLNGKGPAYNRNFAIKSCFGEYIVTMDSDAFLDRDWVSKIVGYMEKNSSVGICGGKILYSDDRNKINMAGGGLKKWGVPYHRGAGESKDKSEYNKIRKTIYLCTASLIMRREVFKKIGGFDSDYFYGYEDTDFSWRANIAGFDIVYFPEAVSYHELNVTIKSFASARRRFLSSRNRVLTLLKNYETLSLIKYFPLLLGGFLYTLIFKDNRIMTLRAYIWNIKNWKFTAEKRKKINKIRKRRDKELLKLF